MFTSKLNSIFTLIFKIQINCVFEDLYNLSENIQLSHTFCEKKTPINPHNSNGLSSLIFDRVGEPSVYHRVVAGQKCGQMAERSKALV